MPSPSLPETAPAAVLTVQNGQVGASINQLAGEVAERPARWKGREVRIDFRALDYVDSRELGALVTLNRKVKSAGGRLTLVNVRPFVSGVLEVTRLDTILDVHRADQANGA
jgi:anti-sigma B factor antagonist